VFTAKLAVYVAQGTRSPVVYVAERPVYVDEFAVTTVSVAPVQKSFFVILLHVSKKSSTFVGFFMYTR
jgi:hypothetical protein